MDKEQEYAWSKFIRKSAAQFLLDLAHGRLRELGPERYGDHLTNIFFVHAVEMGLLSQGEAGTIMRRIPDDIQQEKADYGFGTAKTTNE